MQFRSRLLESSESQCSGRQIYKFNEDDFRL